MEGHQNIRVSPGTKIIREGQHISKGREGRLQERKENDTQFPRAEP